MPGRKPLITSHFFLFMIMKSSIPFLFVSYSIRHFLRVFATLGAFTLCGCAGVSPMGGALAGTDADWVRLSGNSRTGEFTFEAHGLNQSRSVEHATETMENLTRLKVYSQVFHNAAGQAGDLAADSLQ